MAVTTNLPDEIESDAVYKVSSPGLELEGEGEVMWLVGSELEKEYPSSTWFRCMGIQDFIEKVKAGNKIVGVIAEGNNIGFILDEKDSDQIVSVRETLEGLTKAAMEADDRAAMESIAGLASTRPIGGAVDVLKKGAF